MDVGCLSLKFSCHCHVNSSKELIARKTFVATTMTTLRQFRLDDLLKFNNINLDVLTETYNMTFYMSYMSQWPEAFTGTVINLKVLIVT